MMMQEDEFGHEGYDGDDSPGRYGRQDEIREEGNRRAYGLYGRQEDRSGQEVRRGQEDLVEIRRVQVHGTQVLGEGSRAREATRKRAASKSAKAVKDETEEMTKTEELANEDSSDDLDDVQVDEDGLENLDDDLDDVDDGGLDGDDDDIDDESGEDDDVPEDEEDDEGTEPGRKEPEQPKEKGAFVVRDDDDDENLTPSGNPKRRVIAAGATADPVKDYLKQIGRVSLLNAEQEVDLSERIEPPVRPAPARYRERRHGLQAQARAQVGGERRQEGQGPPAGGEPATRGVAGQALHRSWHALPRPDSGRQPGPHPSRREVRLEEGLQVLHLCHVVDPSGHHPRMADQARTIRVPVHMVEVINKLSRVQRQMLQDLGREPTPDELARELDMPVEKVQEVQKYGREPISLHTPLGEDGDSEFGDLIEDTDASRRPTRSRSRCCRSSSSRCWRL